MENQEFPVTLCYFDPAEPGPYEQYILPQIAAEMRQEPERFAALGAVWDNYAAGTAVFTEDPDDPEAAALVSLFVDPQVRRRGIGTALLNAFLTGAADSGLEKLTLSYTLDREELDAMDCFVRAMGGVPMFINPVYTMASVDFHDSRLVGRAFRPDFRMPENVVRYIDLTPEQLESLHADPDAPWYSPGMQPELSLAYLWNGRVVGFWFGCMTTPGNYAVQGIWRSPAAPFNTLHVLLMAHVNLCYSHGGGDFLYYASTSVEFVDRFLRTYTEGKYHRMERHYTIISCQ